MEIYNNIKTLVRKYPIPVILNIMGLVLAFTAFIMIMAYVRFEWNFDRCYPKSDCIFESFFLPFHSSNGLCRVDYPFFGSCESGHYVLSVWG